jgi:phosphoribosylanthranilate isomerase
MNLKTVTLTGIDEKTEVSKICSIARDFPFVEWGILLSVSKTGLDPRYPSLRKMREVSDAGLPLAVHLCGSLARAAAWGDNAAIITAISLVPNAKRVQVNLGKQIDHYPTLYRDAQMAGQTLRTQIIVQSYSFTSRTVKKAVEAVRFHKTLEERESQGAVFLHDASGGRGIVGPFEKPINRDFVGFAGGIAPENVAQKLDEIEALDFPNPVWIDMESGVRTDDILDIGKVRRVLEIVAPLVTK